MIYFNLFIDGYKLPFKITSRFVDIKNKTAIHTHLLKFHRRYVINKKMQHNILTNNFKLVELG